MKFKELTEEQIKSAKEIYFNKEITWDDRMLKLIRLFEKSERTVRKWCVKLGFKEKDTPEPEILKIAKNKEHSKDKKIFLITSAQNATSVHKNFVKNMETYAEFLNAEILVIPYRYKNPTSVFSEKQENDDWWDSKITKYLTLNRHDLNNSVSVLSDVKIQPTNSQPLQGLEGMTGDHSCVVGHPRLELKSIPVMDSYKPKLLFTTGSCTKPNYTDSRAGKRGEFHHSLAFCIVEIKDDDIFFFRQVSANNKGEFIDLNNFVSEEKISKEKSIEALIMGDIHVRYCDERITDITKNDLIPNLNPSKIFLHDIIDSGSISHHNTKDPFLLHEMELNGSNDLANEINEMIEWLKDFQKFNVYIVKSNHDEHLDRYLCENDWRKLPTMKNSIPYMELSLAKLKGDAKNGILPYIINKNYPKMKCLTYDDNIVVKGWLCSIHGHNGSGGSRGSLEQFSKLSTKTVTGHSHRAGRVAGAVSVGTSTGLKLQYLKGQSAWTNTHGIINRLGKFQHIFFFLNKNNEMEYTTIIS
jgi:hypothetical protein